MTGRPPVADWATDFDHTDPRWTEDPYTIMADLRGRCPMARSERYGGLHAPMRYADIRAIAYDTGHFSSKRVVIRENPPNVPLPSPPITSDPPHHKPARMLLLPARCIGSNLARMEITIALEEWLKRFPRFTLQDKARIAWSKGPVRGPRTVPVRLG